MAILGNNTRRSTNFRHPGHLFPENLCARWCSCRCHWVRNLRSPQFLSSAVGNVSIHCGARRLSCNETGCKRRGKSTIMITYRFPKWLMNSAIHFYLASSALSAQASLTILNIVPESAEIFVAVSTGDLLGIQRMFQEARASILDVDEHNWTLLHVRAF